jgi:hypothetical protein
MKTKKLYCLSVFFCIISAGVFAQGEDNDRITSDFFRDIFTTEHLTLKKIISEQLGYSVVTDIINRVGNRKVIQAGKPDSVKAMFSKEELDFFKKQLVIPSSNWVVKYFKNARIVNTDTFNVTSGEILYYYSKPVFFNNNTQCIFYAGDYCGGRCSSGRLSLYKFQEGRWVLDFHLFRRVS